MGNTKPPLALLQGTLDVLILKALSLGPNHGYGISLWVRQRTDGELLVEDAALYQALHRLERQALIDAEWGLSENNRRAKFYELTPDGPHAPARRGLAVAAVRRRRLQGPRTRSLRRQKDYGCKSALTHGFHHAFSSHSAAMLLKCVKKSMAISNFRFAIFYGADS